MSDDDYRFAMSADEYLDRYEVLVYLQDAVAQLLEHKDDASKTNIAKYFGDYFSSVKTGNHVLFREYSYVCATVHNRASFVRTVWKCFRHIDLLSVREYHSLLCLLCPDFAFEPLQKTARIVLMDDALDCLISFSDFLYAFQAQYIYDDFLTNSFEVYSTLISKPPKNNPETVVVPTEQSDAEQPTEPDNKKASFIQDSSLLEGVDSAQFCRALQPVCEKMGHKAPPATVIREIICSAERVTFYGFLMAMAKSEALNKAIGKLPPKNELLIAQDSELTSPLEMMSRSDEHVAVQSETSPGSSQSHTDVALSGRRSITPLATLTRPLSRRVKSLDNSDDL